MKLPLLTAPAGAYRVAALLLAALVGAGCGAGLTSADQRQVAASRYTSLNGATRCPGGNCNVAGFLRGLDSINFPTGMRPDVDALVAAAAAIEEFPTVDRSRSSQGVQQCLPDCPSYDPRPYADALASFVQADAVVRRDLGLSSLGTTSSSG